MFLIQSHKDLLTNSMYQDCEDAKQYRVPVSINHMEYLRKLSYLATIEDGVVTHVQALTAVDDTIYVYVDKISPQLINELRMVLRPGVVAAPGKFYVVCKPEGRDSRVPAVTYGFVIPKEMQSMEKLVPLIGRENAVAQLHFISQLDNPQHEAVMNMSPDEQLATQFVAAGLKFVNVFYPL